MSFRFSLRLSSIVCPRKDMTCLCCRIDFPVWGLRRLNWKVRVSLWQDAPGEAKAGSQHLRDVEELRFDFVLLDHLMCWFDCRIVSEKIGTKRLWQIHNSQFVFLCAVLILRDVPSMVACDLSWLPFSRWKPLHALRYQKHQQRQYRNQCLFFKHSIKV